MADQKISALAAASTPLAGTEVLPIVQSGTTKKVAVSDLTTGRAISATQVTVSTGNVIIGTSGQGIDFSATPGTGTSELLADYEEGTWTPTLNAFTQSGGGTVTTLGYYTKIGRQVTITGSITCAGGATLSATAGVSTVGAVPFIAAPNTIAYASSWWNSVTIASYGIGQVYTTVVYPTTWAAGANHTISFTATYFV